MKKVLFIVFLSFVSSVFAQEQSERLTIRDIAFVGNQKTQDRIINRELSFKEGETYSRDEFDSIFVWNKNRIYNTNLFNTVELSLGHEKDSLVDVVIALDERWYLYPFPIFRLIDRNFNDWWVNQNRDLSRVNYGVNVTHYNFRGRKELLRVILQSGFTNVLNVQYSIPYIDKQQKQGLYFDLSYVESKSVSYTTQENLPVFTSNLESDLRRVYSNLLSYSYRNSFYSQHRAWLGHYHVRIADTLSILNPNYLGDGRTLQRYFYAGYSYSYNKVNNINYPTEGASGVAGVFKHGLGIHDDGVDYWRARLKLSHYRNLKNNFYAASDVSILATFPEERDYFNYYKIGLFPETLRGYDLNIIEGSHYIIQRNELKYNFFGKKFNISKVMPLRQFQTFPLFIYGKVFFDQGYAKGYPDYEGSQPLSDNYLYSIGTGLDLVMVNDITLRLEYSRNAQGNTYFFINFLALL